MTLKSDATTQKSEKFTSMGYVCLKYMRLELNKYRGVTFHDAEQWTVMQNLNKPWPCGFKNDTSNWVKLH